MSSNKDNKHDCDKHKHKPKPKPKPKPKHDHCEKEQKCEKKCDCKEKCKKCKECECKCECKEKECKECKDCKKCKCECKEKECKECKDCKECECKCKEKDCKPECKPECKPKVSVVKECYSIEFTVPHGKEQTIFTSSGNNIGSGFISYDCGDARYITVRFYNGPFEVGNSIQVFQDSSVAFNLSDFNRITVTCPANAPGTIPGFGDDCPGQCDGAINLNLRFPVDFD
jgi:hypothetical protein